jgi:hypothetical protein
MEAQFRRIHPDDRKAIAAHVRPFYSGSRWRIEIRETCWQERIENEGELYGPYAIPKDVKWLDAEGYVDLARATIPKNLDCWLDVQVAVVPSICGRHFTSEDYEPYGWHVAHFEKGRLVKIERSV